MKPVGRRKRRRRLCRRCGQRRATYRRPHGGIGKGAGHDLCQACYQSALDRLHAVRMADERREEVCAEISAR